MNAKRIRTTGDSPFNVRNERGSKQSCMVRAAELLGVGGIVAATAVAALDRQGEAMSQDIKRDKAPLYRVHERAGKLARELEAELASNAKLVDQVAELKAQLSNDDATEVRARIENYLRVLDTKADEDEAYADTDSGRDRRNDLTSRLAAVTRARQARKFVKGVREILNAGEGPKAEYPKYFRRTGLAGSFVYFRQFEESSALEVWPLLGKAWSLAAPGALAGYSYIEISTSGLPEGVKP